MTRLIDADDLKYKNLAEVNGKLTYVLTAEEIDNAPTVPYSRPQGEWIRSSNMSKKSYRRVCDQCHHISYFCGDGNYPNCPYCLADMSKGGTDK